MVTGGGGKPIRRTDPGLEIAPGGMLPAGAPGDAGRVPAGSGRVRRPADLLFGVLSLAVVAVVLGNIRALPLGSTELADDVSAWLHHIPGWLSSAAEVVSGVACFILAIVAVVVMVRSHWQDARNAAVAGFTGAAAAIAASAAWRAENGTIQRAVLHGSNPSILVVDTAFVAFVVGTDLTRRSHWSRWWPCAVAALLLSGLAVGALTPFAVSIVLFGGLLAGWLVRWLLGAASVLPSPAELVPWLKSQGTAVRELAGDRRTRLEGTLADGTRIQVRLSGRDTRGSGLARRLWALARLRPAAAGHIAISSRAQLEQLALGCSLARQARVVVVTARRFEALVASGVRVDALVGSGNDRGEQFDLSRLAVQPEHVVVTDGERGGTGYRVVVPPGPVVDSYGAGDTFVAGVLFGLADGRPLEEALALGAAAAAETVTWRGAYPTRPWMASW